jgi:hypothetical protein
MIAISMHRKHENLEKTTELATEIYRQCLSHKVGLDTSLRPWEGTQNLWVTCTVYIKEMCIQLPHMRSRPRLCFPEKIGLQKIM